MEPAALSAGIGVEKFARETKERIEPIAAALGAWSTQAAKVMSIGGSGRLAAATLAK